MKAKRAMYVAQGPKLPPGALASATVWDLPSSWNTFYKKYTKYHAPIQFRNDNGLIGIMLWRHTESDINFSNKKFQIPAEVVQNWIAAYYSKESEVK